MRLISLSLSYRQIRILTPPRRSCLPRRKEILDGMLGANLICFQTYSYSRHFTSSCVRVCGYESTSRGGIDVSGHVTNITYCPVGVDAERVAKDM